MASYVHLFVTDMLLRINKFGNFQCSSQMMLRNLRLASCMEQAITYFKLLYKKILFNVHFVCESQFATLGKRILYYVFNDRKYAADC